MTSNVAFGRLVCILYPQFSKKKLYMLSRFFLLWLEKPNYTVYRKKRVVRKFVKFFILIYLGLLHKVQLKKDFSQVGVWNQTRNVVGKTIGLLWGFFHFHRKPVVLPTWLNLQIYLFVSENLIMYIYAMD